MTRSRIIADRWRDVAFEARALVYHGSLDHPAVVPLSDVHNASYIAELTISPVGSPDLPLLRLDEPVEAERELLALLVEAPADITALLQEIARLQAHIMVDNGLLGRALTALSEERYAAPSPERSERQSALLTDMRAWLTGQLEGSDDRA